MATMQRRLVHKQFNSPINLYSQRNIQETLDRELKQLSNGAIGIDFDDPSTTKPPSLAKSAVLQALEDEERQQSRAGKGLKRVAWPPPAEFGDGEYQHQQPVQQQQQPYHYPPQQQQQQQQHPAHQQPLQQNYPQQQHYQQPPTQPQQHQPRERIIPIQRPEPSSQQPQYQPQPTQAFQPLVSAHDQQQQLQQQQHHQEPLYQQPEAAPQQQYQQFYHTTAADSQIPFVTTLRKEAPMSQEPSPVYHTEPVAAIYQGGTNMRGDQKWPPADVKKQSELENEERRKLAQQPAFRPRKVQKDYSDFFAKNALNATYPGYRAPPGTQHHS